MLLTNEELLKQIDQIDLVVDKHEESITLLLKLRQHLKDQIKYKLVRNEHASRYDSWKKVPK